MNILGCLDQPTAGKLHPGRYRHQANWMTTRSSEIRSQRIGFIFSELQSDSATDRTGEPGSADVLPRHPAARAAAARDGTG